VSGPTAVILFTAALILHGCASLHPAPTGSMWAYFMEGIEAAPGVRAITYTLDPKNCEAARTKAQTSSSTPANPRWIQVAAGLPLAPGRITGSSPWHLSTRFRGRGIFLGLGVDDRDACVKVRQFYVRTPASRWRWACLGICEPVGCSVNCHRRYPALPRGAARASEAGSSATGREGGRQLRASTDHDPACDGQKHPTTLIYTHGPEPGPVGVAEPRRATTRPVTARRAIRRAQPIPACPEACRVR